MKKASSTPVVSHMKKKTFPETSKGRIQEKYPHHKAENLDEKSQYQPRPPKR